MARKTTYSNAVYIGPRLPTTGTYVVDGKAITNPTEVIAISLGKGEVQRAYDDAWDLIGCPREKVMGLGNAFMLVSHRVFRNIDDSLESIAEAGDRATLDEVQKLFREKSNLKGKDLKGVLDSLYERWLWAGGDKYQIQKMMDESLERVKGYVAEVVEKKLTKKEARAKIDKEFNRLLSIKSSYESMWAMQSILAALDSITGEASGIGYKLKERNFAKSFGVSRKSLKRYDLVARSYILVEDLIK